MTVKNSLSRRQFVGGVAAAIGYAGLGPSVDVFAQNARGAGQAARAKMPLAEAVAEYDAAAKLANNENPFGPPDSVIKAMTNAFKYANRYGYPDGNIEAATLGEAAQTTTSTVMYARGYNAAAEAVAEVLGIDRVAQLTEEIQSSASGVAGGREWNVVAIIGQDKSTG